MKNTIFLIFAIMGIIAFLIAALVLTIALSDSSAGMIAVLYAPMLTAAFGASLLAFILKMTQKLTLGKFANVMNTINTVVLIFSTCGFLHLFFFD